ncbi:MAG: WYL domain-containing protein [Actinomycetaceae bacterium]|nr:WYL domain-containing protein [Actinomycetaceae bacterium]
MSAKNGSGQRLLSLLLALSYHPHALTKKEIYQLVLGYDTNASEEAKERQFSRDKRSLERAGCDITLAVNVEGEDTYRIFPPKQRWHSELTSSECALINQAMELWGDASGSGAEKIRAAAGEVETLPRGMEIVHSGLTQPALIATVWEAMNGRRQISFKYPGADGQWQLRKVEPWRMLVNDSQILLHCWDCDRQAPRHFNITRIKPNSCKILGSEATQDRPDTSDTSVTKIRPLLLLKAGRANLIRERCTPATAQELDSAFRRYRDLSASGWDLMVGNFDSYKRWWDRVMSDPENCLVLSPLELKENVVAALDHVAKLAEGGENRNAETSTSKRRQSALEGRG